MYRRRPFIALCAIVVLCAAAFAPADAIPADKVDPQQIYYGSPDSFEKPGKVDFKAVVKATPEYAEIIEKNVERGTARFWILMSQASDRAVSVIAEVGKESEYDLIAAAGYLGSLDPPIAADDVTALVLEVLEE